MPTRALRVALIGSSRFPVAQPFAGGLEACLWSLARRLRDRGHEVTLFAAEGSDPDLGVTTIVPPVPDLSSAARADVSMPAEWVVREHHAYLGLMLELGRRAGDFDVVHNHALHYLPIAMAHVLGRPMLSTLHTPPTPWLESAVQLASGRNRFVAVSGHTARSWGAAGAEVILNGVDLDRWPVGPGGPDLVWSGRIVAEKGPDLAARAARLAGRRLAIAGPVGDRAFFERTVVPLLGEGVDYVGHLGHADLAHLVGSSSAALVTPRWDEPYGLVTAEALACGTPVAGFDRGGTAEIVDRSSGVLVAPDDVEALAAAIPVASALSRTDARRRAETHCSLDRTVDAYERVYAELAA